VDLNTQRLLPQTVKLWSGKHSSFAPIGRRMSRTKNSAHLC
jgi:hypothetical protein